MALSRVKTWIANETLTAADLNAEFDNITAKFSSSINPADINQGGTFTWTASHTWTDDDLVIFGTGTDYWLVYDSANTQFELNSTDVDGAGTNGVIFHVGDGTNIATWTAAISVDETTDTTSGTTGSIHTDGGLGVAKNLFVATNAEVTGTTTFTGVTTHGGNIVSDTDSTDDLGTTSVRWANLFVDSIGDVGQTLAMAIPDLTIFHDANNADTSLSIGTSATEALKIEVLNGAANKTAEEVRFTTSTASATANAGQFGFYVDDTLIGNIDDGGINLATGLAFTVNDVAVGGAALTGSTNNTITTVTGADAIQGEANLTFDGTDLAIGNAAPSSYIDSVHGVIVGDTGDATSEIVIATSASGTAELNFTDTATTTNQGSVLYSHTSDYMAFSTSNAERMRIGSSGKVGIGTTTLNQILNVSGPVASNYAFSVQNTSATNPQGIFISLGGSPDDNVYALATFNDSTTTRCIIHSDGDLANHDGTYGTISDVKFKQDIVGMRSYWDDFKALQYRKFRHISDVEADSNASYRLGLIAQEVETVFPALVPESPDPLVEMLDTNGDPVLDADGKPTYEPQTTYKWVKSSIIEGPIMASVVQELQARVEALEAV